VYVKDLAPAHSSMVRMSAAQPFADAALEI
jgi:hypothetical protein